MCVQFTAYFVNTSVVGRLPINIPGHPRNGDIGYLAELGRLQKDGRTVQLIDARTASQYQQKHIPGTDNIPQ
jgi:hypothetical protein